MADPHVISALQSKRNEIEGYIRTLEKKATDARHELMHVNAALRLFAIEDPKRPFPVYMAVRKLLKRGELLTLCLDALAKAEGPLTTRELAVVLIEAKRLDASDPVLRQALCHRISLALTRLSREGRVGKIGKRNGATIWASAKAS